MACGKNNPFVIDWFFQLQISIILCDSPCVVYFTRDFPVMFPCFFQDVSIYVPMIFHVPIIFSWFFQRFLWFSPWKAAKFFRSCLPASPGRSRLPLPRIRGPGDALPAPRRPGLLGRGRRRRTPGQWGNWMGWPWKSWCFNGSSRDELVIL